MGRKPSRIRKTTVLAALLLSIFLAAGIAFSQSPPGGITSANYREYLALDNVACVGGSWVAPQGAMDQGDWARITALAREAVERSGR